MPDFIDADGIEYTDIEVIVEMDGDIRDTVQLVKTLERPLTKRSANEKAADCTPSISSGNAKYSQAVGRHDMFQAFRERRP